MEKEKPKKPKKIKQEGEKNSDSKKIIAVVRITGQVKLKPEIKNTLERLRLGKKYSCSIFKESKDILGMIKKVRDFAAFGEIEKQTLIKLIEKRGKNTENKKFDAEKIADELIHGKKLKELGFKPFFSMHPPIHGIKSKFHYPKGVLGDNKKDINKLIERML